jgi:hypothetical protein
VDFSVSLQGLGSKSLHLVTRNTKSTLALSLGLFKLEYAPRLAERGELRWFLSWRFLRTLSSSELRSFVGRNSGYSSRFRYRAVR